MTQTRYTIAPGETLDYTFDFNGPSPGPALQAGQTISSHTATVTGGPTLGSSSINGGTKVLARVSCPTSVPLNTRAQLRAVATTSTGEVLVDQIELRVAV
jgi:hypothetical protein